MISIIVYQEDILVLTSSSFYQDDILVLTTTTWKHFQVAPSQQPSSQCQKINLLCIGDQILWFHTYQRRYQTITTKGQCDPSNLPPPNIEQVRSFIGMLNYYKAMIPCKTPSFYHCLLHLPRRISNLNGQQNINKPSTHSKIHSLAKLSLPTWTSPFPSKSTPTPQNTKLDLSLPKRQATCILFKETY
jgi:hypothetical protein